MTVCFAPRAIVFDLDGTLIDSVPGIQAACNAVLRDHGFRPITPLETRSFVGGGVEVLWNRIIAAVGADPLTRRDMIAGYMSRYVHASLTSKLYPHVTETLGALADRGHPLGLCTNKPMQHTRRILDHIGLGAVFQTIVAGDSQPEKKPHPAPLRAALADLGDDPANPAGLYVGDSEYDAACALAVRVPFLLHTSGYMQARVENMPHAATFADFSALPALIEAMAE